MFYIENRVIDFVYLNVNKQHILNICLSTLYIATFVRKKIPMNKLALWRLNS